MDMPLALGLSIGVLMSGRTYVALGAVAFAWVLQATFPPLAIIPDAFLGTATTVSVVVGARGTHLNTVIALVAGAVLGFVSELIAGRLAKPAA